MNQPKRITSAIAVRYTTMSSRPRAHAALSFQRQYGAAAKVALATDLTEVYERATVGVTELSKREVDLKAAPAV
jgi:hypothetical protein